MQAGDPLHCKSISVSIKRLSCWLIDAEIKKFKVTSINCPINCGHKLLDLRTTKSRCRRSNQVFKLCNECMLCRIRLSPNFKYSSISFASVSLKPTRKTTNVLVVTAVALICMIDERSQEVSFLVTLPFLLRKRFKDHFSCEVLFFTSAKVQSSYLFSYDLFHSIHIYDFSQHICLPPFKTPQSYQSDRARSTAVLFVLSCLHHA